MIDKKKVRWIVIVAGAALIVAVVIMVQSVSGRMTGPQPMAEPSVSATPTQPEITLDAEEKHLLIKAAQIAATYYARAEKALKPADYIKAGFTESLASRYRPIWEGIFAGRADQPTAAIGITSLDKPRPKVIDYSGPKPGSYTLKVAVPMRWAPWDVRPAPGKESAFTYGRGGGTATWILTYDQLSKRVLDVQQPAWQDLDATELFDALGLPVPTSPSKETSQ